MKKPPDILLIPLGELTLEQTREKFQVEEQMTPEEEKSYIEYTTLTREIREYDEEREKYAHRHELWDEPLYKLHPDFQAYVQGKIDKANQATTE